MTVPANFPIFATLPAGQQPLSLFDTAFAMIYNGQVPITANNLAVGTTTISGGANGQILFDNNGFLGEKAISGNGNVVLATGATLTNPIFVNPALGTPASGVLTNATGLPISTGVSGLAAGVATFLGTPTSANLAAALTDGTGSGSAVFATGPILSAPVLGAATGTSLALSGSGLAPFASTSTDAGAASGPVAELFRDKAGPAAADLLGQLLFTGRSSTAVKRTYANTLISISSPTNGAENAIWTDQIIVAGAAKSFLSRGALASGTFDANALGLPNGQLSFPAVQNPSTNVNTLDDYKEGTWTPALVPQTSGTITLTSPNNSMKYVKVGGMVTVSGLLTVSSVNAPTGLLVCTGLPFASANNNGNNAAIALRVALFVASAGATWEAYVPANSSQINIDFYTGSAGTTGGNPSALIQATTTIVISGSYFVV